MKLIRDYTEDQFHRQALEIFRYQVEHVPVFGKFAGALGTDVKAVRAIEDIPFLPVNFLNTTGSLIAFRIRRLFLSQAAQRGWREAGILWPTQGCTGKVL